MASNRNGLIMGKKHVKFIKVCQVQVIQLELHPFLTGCQVDRFDKNWFNPWHLQEVEELLRPVLADCDLSDVRTLKTKETHKLTQTCLVGPNVRIGIKLKPKMEHQSLLVRSAFSPGYQWSSIQPMKLVAYVCPRLQGNQTSVTSAFGKLLKKRDQSETPDISNYFCPVTSSSSSHRHHTTTTHLPSMSRNGRSSHHQDSCAPTPNPHPSSSSRNVRSSGHQDSCAPAPNPHPSSTSRNVRSSRHQDGCVPKPHPSSTSSSVKSFLNQDFCAPSPAPTTAVLSCVCDADCIMSIPPTKALRSSVYNTDSITTNTLLACAGSSLSASKNGAHRVCELDSGTEASDGTSAVCGHPVPGCVSTEDFTQSCSSGLGQNVQSSPRGPCAEGFASSVPAVTESLSIPSLPSFQSSPWCQGIEAASDSPGPIFSGCVTDPIALTTPTDIPTQPSFQSSTMATPNHHLVSASVCCSPPSMSAIYSTASMSRACPAVPSAQSCPSSLCPEDIVQSGESSEAISTVRHGDTLTNNEIEAKPAHTHRSSEVQPTCAHSSTYIKSELCKPAIRPRDSDDRSTRDLAKPVVVDLELTQDQDMPTLVRCVDLKPSRKKHAAPVLEPVDTRPTPRPMVTADPPTLDGPQGSSPWQPLSPLSDDYGLDSWELPDLAGPPLISAACSSEPEREEEGLSKTVGPHMPMTKTTKKAKPTFRMFSKNQKLSTPKSVESERRQLMPLETYKEEVPMSKSVMSSTLTENSAVSKSARAVRQGKELSLSRSDKFVNRRRKPAPLKPSTTVSNKQSPSTLGQSVSPSSKEKSVCRPDSEGRELVRTGSDYSKGRSPVPLTSSVRSSSHKPSPNKPSILKPGSDPSKGSRSPVPVSPPARPSHDKPAAKRPFIQLIDIDFTLSSPDLTPRTKKKKYSPTCSPISHSGNVYDKAVREWKNGQKSSHKHLNGQHDKCHSVNGQQEKSGKTSEHKAVHRDSDVLKTNSKLSPLRANDGGPVASLSSRFAHCKKGENGERRLVPYRGLASHSENDKHSKADTLCSTSQPSPECRSPSSPSLSPSYFHKTGPGKKSKVNKVAHKTCSNETKLHEKRAGHKKGASTYDTGHKLRAGHKTSAINTNSARNIDFNQTSSSGSADEKMSSLKTMPSTVGKTSQSSSKPAGLSTSVLSFTSSCDTSSMSSSLSVITSVSSTSSSNKVSYPQPRKPHSPKTSKTFPESPRPPSVSKKRMADAQPRKPQSQKTLLRNPSTQSSLFSSDSPGALSTSPVVAACQPLSPGPLSVGQEGVARQSPLHEGVVCCGDEESSDGWLPPLDIPFTTDLPDLPSVRGSELSPSLDSSQPSPHPSPISPYCSPQHAFNLPSNSESLHASNPTNSGKPHSVNTPKNKNDRDGKQCRKLPSASSPTSSPANRRKRPLPNSPENKRDGAHKQLRKSPSSLSPTSSSTDNLKHPSPKSPENNSGRAHKCHRKSPSSSSPNSSPSNSHTHPLPKSPENNSDKTHKQSRKSPSSLPARSLSNNRKHCSPTSPENKGDRDKKWAKKAPRERSPLSSLPQYNSKADGHKFVSEHRSMSTVSDQQLMKLVLKYSHDLKAIAAGSLHCDRHAQYMKGGLARRALDHASNLQYFGSGQEDAVMDSLMSLFPSHQVKEMDYMLRVLLPEALERIYTHVTGIALT